MANKDVKFLDATSITYTGGFSQPIFVGDLITAVVTVVGTGTVIAHGSAQEDAPDFSAPSTITNSHVPVVLADYTTANTYYNGGAGVTVAASTQIVELNTNLLNWICLERSGGGVEATVTSTNNQ